MPLADPTLRLVSRDDNAHLTFEIENKDDTYAINADIDYRLDSQSSWTELADVGIIFDGETITYETDQFFLAEAFEVRLVATGGDETVRTDPIEVGATVDPPPGRSVLLNRADETTRWLPRDRAPSSLRLEREHTAMSSWEADVAVRNYPKVEIDWHETTTEAHVWWTHPRTGGSEYLFRGYFEDISAASDTPAATAGGRDVLKRLTEGRASAQYQAEPTHQAIASYIATNTEFDVDLTQPSPTQIATDQQVQSASTQSQWEAITSLEADEPVEISGGEMTLAQTAWPTPAVDMTQSGGSFFEASRFVDGESKSLNGAGDSLSFDFTPAYDIPAERVGVKVRYEADNAGEIDFAIGNTTFATIPSGTSANLAWREFGDSFDEDGNSNTFGGVAGWEDSGGGTLSAGQTYTFTVQAASAASNYFRTDIVAVYDTQSGHTFDDTVDGDNQLSRPGLAPPTGHEVELDVADVGFNISAADVSINTDSTANQQSIAASNDNGASYPLGVDNSDSLDQTFSTSQPGTQARVKFTLSPHGSQTDTPTENHLRQSIGEYTLKLSGNDLSVIDDQTFNRSHFRNIIDMAEFADYRIVPKYDPNTLELAVFPRGTEADAEWRQLGYTREVSTRGYFNAVYVEGKTPDGGGDPPSAYIEDQSEIAAAGQTITLDIKDPQLERQADCASKARTVLADVAGADTVTGSVDIVPQSIQPGYSYPVDDWIVQYPYGTDYGAVWGGGQDAPVRPLERVTYAVRAGGPGSDATLRGTLRFESDRAQGDPLIQLRRDTDQTRDSL